jgi:NAD(P)H-hydrate epimerase
MKYVNKDDIRKSRLKREPWCHKGDFGKVLIIGGSERYSGAPALSALAAMRSGCDSTLVIAPERAADIIPCFSPDLIVESVEGNFFRPSHLKEIMTIIDDFDALVIGGGIGLQKDTGLFVRELISNLKIPCVIDADAIKLMGGISLPHHRIIITPNSKEFEILTGRTVGRDIDHRANLTKQASGKYGCTILLKGHIDVISDGVSLLFNRTGSVYMTKGGTGDILSGICGAFISVGTDPLTSAANAAFVNGMAGGDAAKQFGNGLLASDLLRSIPSVINAP